jgi:2,2-dialkylglycine decarboxylase (pyruvate)
VLREEKLDRRADELGTHLRDGLRALGERHAVIGDVRGRGLLVGLELVRDRATREPADELGTAVTRRCLELGLHVNVVQLPAMGGVFRIAPALTSTREELDLGLSILDRAIAETAPKFS